LVSAAAVVDCHSPYHPFPDGHWPAAFQDVVDYDHDAPPPNWVVLAEVVDDDDDLPSWFDKED
jgi:hypothetical protein